MRVRNSVMSVDPYMRGRTSDAKSYAAPFELDMAMDGAAVGVVEESRAEGFAIGDHVLHGSGWRQMASTSASTTRAGTTWRLRSAHCGRTGALRLCGMISVYNDTEPAPGPRNLSRLIRTRGTIRGFLVGDHWDSAVSMPTGQHSGSSRVN